MDSVSDAAGVAVATGVVAVAVTVVVPFSGVCAPALVNIAGATATRAATSVNTVVQRRIFL
jgi:hypothetical protein